MSFRDAVERRIFGKRKVTGHKSSAPPKPEVINEDDPRWNPKTMGNGQGSLPKPTFRINPKAKLDPSQVDDRRPGPSRPLTTSQERRRREDFMKKHGPPSSSTPDSQWDGRRGAIQRRQQRRK